MAEDGAAAILAGMPGHSAGTALTRLQPVRIVNGVILDGYTDEWELICPACGDDASLDYASVSPGIQEIRGPYPTQDDARTALELHIGLENSRTRAARGW
jgi:hypothetical protein